MTTNILPASNVINVTITETPSGLTEPNINSVALFTNDTPTNNETYGIYISASQVAANYGTNSDTALMANNIFAQLPNILSGGGSLVIIPMLGAVSATHGNFQTANLSANLAGMIAVSSGSMNVVLDGAPVALLGLNFTNCVTWADIAAVIQAALQDGIVTAISNGIEISSKKVGTGSTVSLTSNTTDTDITGSSYLHQASGTSTAGANSSGETIAACIARTSGLTGYVAILPTIDIEDTAIVTAAAAVQALDNMLFVPRAQTKDIAGIATTIQQATNTKTRVLVYTPTLHAAKLMAAAYVGRAFSVDFTGSLTAQTMNLKSLANVTPDTGITQTLYNAAKTAGCDIYVSYQGVPSVLSTGANDYFDQPYTYISLKFDLTIAGFDYLRQTNTKVPQTEPGMTGLKNAYRQVMQQYVTNGSLAPGSWTSSETFGDPVIFNNNITKTGFYIYSQPVAQQNSTDRENRIAPLVQIAGKYAGAIQEGSVLANINP